LNNNNKNFFLVIFKYFPFGGAQRDMMQLATRLSKNYNVEIITMDWSGSSLPKKIKVKVLKQKSILNYLKYKKFHTQALSYIKSKKNKITISFSKISGFDFYYAADSCFAKKNYNFLLNLLPRNKYFLKEEFEIFKPKSSTKILSISKKENEIYKSIYGTNEKQFIFIPPFMDKKFFNTDQTQSPFFLKNIFKYKRKLLIFVGSGFKTKGLDRAIIAYKSLSKNIRNDYNFLILGKDNPKKYLNLINKYDLTDSVKIIEGHDKIHLIMRESSMLIHPARYENTGLVLLEALSQNLPIITTDNCGFSNYVAKDNKSIVLSSPFLQKKLNNGLSNILKNNYKKSINIKFKKYTEYKLDQLIFKNL
jgi:UDP-glucose:(heptosyl)LPS alpha-1,3-glucosyltransferase